MLTPTAYVTVSRPILDLALVGGVVLLVALGAYDHVGVGGTVMSYNTAHSAIGWAVERVMSYRTTKKANVAFGGSMVGGTAYHAFFRFDFVIRMLAMVVQRFDRQHTVQLVDGTVVVLLKLFKIMAVEFLEG
jgi:hypothetical protein